MKSYKHAIVSFIITSIPLYFTSSITSADVETQKAAPSTPASSEYPDSSGPIWFDPAGTVKNTHVTLKKHPTLKISMYSIKNDNDYGICLNYDDNHVSCIPAKSELWGNHFKDAWGIRPYFYAAIDINTKKILRKDGGSYMCLLEGSPEWYDLIKF